MNLRSLAILFSVSFVLVLGTACKPETDKAAQPGAVAADSNHLEQPAATKDKPPVVTPILPVKATEAVQAVAAISWAKDWETAKKMAAEQKKLVMIDFYTIPCGWCVKLDKDTFPNPDVIKEAANFVPVKLNGRSDGMQMARQYGVQGYPTTVFVDSTGKAFGKIEGYLPPAQYAGRLKVIHESYSKS